MILNGLPRDFSTSVIGRSADACMRRMVEANSKDGFRPVQRRSGRRVGRGDFRACRFLAGKAQPPKLFSWRHATASVGICITGSERDAVNKIIAAAGLKLDLPTAGPKSTSAAPPKDESQSPPLADPCGSN